MRLDKEKYMKRNFTKPTSLDAELAKVDEVFPADYESSFVS